MCDFNASSNTCEIEIYATHNRSVVSGEKMTSLSPLCLSHDIHIELRQTDGLNVKPSGARKIPLAQRSVCLGVPFRTVVWVWQAMLSVSSLNQVYDQQLMERHVKISRCWCLLQCHKLLYLDCNCFLQSVS